MESIRKKFQLTAEACDEVSDLIVDFCSRMQVDPTDGIRYRLSAEDCLVHWLEHGFEGKSLTLHTGMRFRKPYVVLEMEGPQENPIAQGSEDYGPYCDSVLVSLNLKPEYSYGGGRNRVLFRMKRRSLSQMAVMGLMFAAALVVGFPGLLLPAAVREAVLNDILTPLYDTFFRILSCVAGPLIFLSVAWGIYGIGDVETLGRVGKRLILRFLKIVLLAACCAALCFPLLGPGFSASSAGGGKLSDVTEMILGIVPSNIVEPFVSGNTLQIIFLAAVVGIALLYLGQRTRGVAAAIDQISALMGFLMDIISKLVPFVIFLVVVNMIWSGDLWTFLDMWKVAVFFLAAILTTALVFLLLTAWRRKVRPDVLIRKSTGIFTSVMSTTSSVAAFNTMVETCEKKFGIDPSLVGFGVPLGMIMHAPILTVYYLFLAFFFAGRYGVACSPIWLLTAMLLAAIMAVAAPPTPGGDVVVFAMLFSQLGIPSEAVALAIALSAVTDFFCDEAVEQTAMTMTLINVAADLDMIDLDVLRAEQ